MNILSQLTKQSLRRNRTRSVAAFCSIFLAAAMFTLLTTAVYSLWEYVRRGTEVETGDYFVSADHVDEAGLKAAQNDPLIRRVSDLKITGWIGLAEQLGMGTLYPVAAVDTAFFDDMSVPLKEGRLPENSSEILIPEEINYIFMGQGRETWQVGQTVRLDTFDLRKARTEEEDGHTRTDMPAETVAREYTIVGISDNKAYHVDKNDRLYYCLLTLADGGEGEVLWHRLFFQTALRDAAAVLAKQYGTSSALNNDLLQVYGAGGLTQGTGTVLIVALAALGIIAVLSSILIRSIFAVSVTERTREFGLLASIGATPRQIRGLMRREALLLLGAALPLGLAVGVLGAGGLLVRFRDVVARQFTFGEKVPLVLRLSVIALLLAVLICTATVLLSVASPARRASRTVPLEAIRQNRDIRVRPQKGRSSKRMSGLLGVSGWVGTRYERVARGRSRAVTLSLTLCLALFLPGVFVANLMEEQAGAYTADFDFVLRKAAGTVDPAEVEPLRRNPAVEYSVFYTVQNEYAIIPGADLAGEYQNVQSAMDDNQNKDYSTWYSIEAVEVVYIEDVYFSLALEAEGIDPQPYLNGETLNAVVSPFEYNGYMILKGNGERHQLRYAGYGLRRDLDELLCVPLIIPSELFSLSGSMNTRYHVTSDGQLLLEAAGKTFLLEFQTEDEQGRTDCLYRSYDPATGEAGEVLAEAKLPYQRIHTLQRLTEAIDGPRTSHITLVLPLSRLTTEKDIGLGIRVKDLEGYYTVLAKLKALTKDSLLVYSDYRENAVNLLGLAALIRGISIGFLILISLLSGINVFYTVSINTLLRRRDFGILRSLGFTDNDLLRTITAESAGSSLRALLIGIPLGLGLCLLLHRMDSGSLEGFSVPWGVLLLGIAMVLLLTLFSILYSLRLLKKMTPIEAIREENM